MQIFFSNTIVIEVTAKTKNHDIAKRPRKPLIAFNKFLKSFSSEMNLVFDAKELKRSWMWSRT